MELWILNFGTWIEFWLGDFGSLECIDRWNEFVLDAKAFKLSCSSQKNNTCKSSTLFTFIMEF
ncbi:hypothetical protein DIT68_14470 [Brumimicrobium oceani]|uniref:Uncharacterized protein n=1 Tax=Brumimicrobium oceani TaxID=2100725 RepID=A0A2U2X284_9FLAO|nr:hypothetical protein DIT68_14470 [Brumimicrobium oceani]